MAPHPRIRDVTERIAARSRDTRAAYLAAMEAAAAHGPARAGLDCGNIAHACAAATLADKGRLTDGTAPNIGIVTAYNDMLSAHQPLGAYPEIIKEAARTFGATAQVAGGVLPREWWRGHAV